MKRSQPNLQKYEYFIEDYSNKCAIKEPYFKTKDRLHFFFYAFFLLVFFFPLLLFIKLSLEVVLPSPCSECSLILTLLSLLSNVSFEFVLL